MNYGKIRKDNFMYSIAFPNMLSSAKTNLIKDNDATMSNMRLLLASWKTSLFGDPYFGTNIKTFIYEQNNIILKDIIIDDIYLSLQEFLPQVVVNRSDIKLTLKNQEIYCTITCINKLDSQVNLYEINLTEDS